MKKMLLGVAVLAAIAAAAAVSGPITESRTFVPFADKGPAPVSHLKWNQNDGEFQFAMLSDRTGGHRPKIFSQAIARLNLLQPEFVLCVGDLIEGSKIREENLAEWKEVDGYLAQLQMPFFYMVGNHDWLSPEAAKVWQEKLGRDQYHFLYRDVLFLMLNVEDPPGIGNKLGKTQVDNALKVLKDYPNPRWTFVLLHRPLWTVKGDTGWPQVETALGDRPCTIFCGHVHRYQKFVRQGHNYYQLATTGGSSDLKGVEAGQFDHMVWITMKKEGPVFANLLVDSVIADDLTQPRSEEKGMEKKGKKK